MDQEKGVGYKILRLESITERAGVMLDSQTSHTSAPPTAFCSCNLKAPLIPSEELDLSNYLYHLVPPSYQMSLCLHL